ncbi:MAG: SemiSWEET transporter [Candidatus Gribaldobacteria bacterium]|nr:SemiSWEET transporter [Candidatus Gribaldobacteria bacterium]
MLLISLLGLLAGVLTTASAIPQVVKTIKTKQTKDLSLGTYVLVTIGVGLWLVYGFLLHDIPLILANIASVFLNFLILLFKLKYG